MSDNIIAVLSILLPAIGGLVALFGDTYNSKIKRLTKIGWGVGLLILLGLMVSIYQNYNNVKKNIEIERIAYTSILDQLCDQTKLMVEIISQDSLNGEKIKQFQRPLSQAINQFNLNFNRHIKALSPSALQNMQKTSNLHAELMNALNKMINDDDFYSVSDEFVLSKTNKVPLQAIRAYTKEVIRTDSSIMTTEISYDEKFVANYNFRIAVASVCHSLETMINILEEEGIIHEEERYKNCFEYKEVFDSIINSVISDDWK